MRRQGARKRLTLLEHLQGLAANPYGRERPALVVQGGGLRGVYSLAALAVLEEFGLRQAFSMIIGSSAGAINGAYFLAGQACEGETIYLKELEDRRFLSLRRFWKMLDLDHMIDVVLKRRHPLNVARMRESGVPLYVVLTDAETAQARIVSSRDYSVDIYELLRATAALPVLYNRKVVLGGRAYVDGGIAGVVPLDEALCLGAKEALVLLTRGAGHRRTGYGPIFRKVVKVLPHGHSAPVEAKVCSPDHGYNMTMEALESEHASVPRTTWTLRPTNLERMVSHITNDCSRLRDCSQLARADMLALLRSEIGYRDETFCDKVVPSPAGGAMAM